MKAVVMAAPGGPEVLELKEIAEPAIASPTQIKVRIKAAGVNPVDTKIRGRGLLQGELPAVLGCDGAGEVVEVGEAVSRFKPGDAVWLCHGGLGGAQGNYAEFSVLDERHAEPKPANVDFVHAAAAPLVLITACESLITQARLAAGETVLIHAGAGGVGHVAIQIAKLQGARVITTVGSPEKAEFVRGLGADETILYREEDFVARTLELTGGKGADVIYDTVGPDIFKRSIEATAHYGRLVTLLDPGPADWKEARVRNLSVQFTLMLSPWLRNLEEHWARQNRILRQCAEWMDAGKLKIEVERTFPLAQAAEAHRLIEQGGTQGKIGLAIEA
jgi:NADPH2:quinone reductase